ncbi:MAG: type II toxin-antitoxin system antitoxin SocA domain-containing protein [Terriglobia bacterium]|jgi:uncharacterized phage-associated protein
MPYGAKSVANYFLDLAKKDSKNLDPMKIQKLVYFGHGWCLALKDAPLITERIEAWKYGPVIRELYNAFRDAGSGPITHPAFEVQFVGGKMIFRAPSISDQEDDGQVDKQFAFELLGEIWKVYGDFSAIQLSNLTHAEGTPWAKTWSPNRINSTISDELIKSYFKEQAAKA